MSINRVRRILYDLAKYLGDLAAVRSAGRKKSTRPLFRRAGRRIAGKATGRVLGHLFR